MIEIRIHGRGGQGGVTLAKILAGAERLEGRSVQAFGIYAAERSGAPLQAFLRCDDRPIHNPNQIYEPDHIIVLDPTLISPAILSGLKPGGFILLNTDATPEDYTGRERVAPFRVATVDATSIAVANGLGTRTVPIVNTALAGAMARLLDLRLESVLATCEGMGFHAGNLAAARRAFDEVRWMERPARRAEPTHVATPRQRVPGLVDGNSGSRPGIHTGEWASREPRWENATPPCNFTCPAGNDVQGFLAQLAHENVDGALETLLRTTPLPSVCGRVCPGFCMQECNRIQLDGAVNVRALERYAGDHGKAAARPQPRRQERVAVIGSGPAGLSGAYHLALLGYPVTLYERDGELGGLMRTGIPTYRLPRAALDRDIERVLALGVEVRLNSKIDHHGLQTLADEYDAVLAATGLQRLTSMELGLDGERVAQGIEFLDLARSGDVRVDGERVIVVGGGNTAIDAARSAFRLGAASVLIVYRRTREEMPAIAEEVDEALDEGIDIEFLSAPVRIERRHGEMSLVCQRMRLGPPDDSGRRRPVAAGGADQDHRCDRVILALGQKPDLSLLPAGAGLSEQGQLCTNGGAGVYAAGDLLTNEGTVTAAIGCGRDMALRLHERFSGESPVRNRPAKESVVRADRIRLQHFERAPAQAGMALPLADRGRSFAEVRHGLDGPGEALRCLSCGVCNACDRCVTYCPDGVLRREGDRIVFDYDYCKGCGICVTECSRAVIYMREERAGVS
jgi:2-oxoacid:acceptor oxidoreductase gamma subunit (pyruvate/2-ketoisovalerate family)